MMRSLLTLPDKLKVLVVCGRNRKRSLTAEVLFKNHPHIIVRSAGVSSAARHVVSHRDIAWADQIWCMEEKHARKLRELFPEVISVKILDIPDEYAFMDAELIELLTEESMNV